MNARSTAVTRSGRKVRTPLVDIDKDFLAYLTAWGVTKDAGALRDKAKAAIKSWFEHGGDSAHEITVNDNGSQFVEFEAVKEIVGRKFAGIENRRTVTSALDLDLIDEWLETLPKAKREKISAQILKPVTEYVLNPDELFKLNQEGVIDDDTLDSLYQTSETWALCVVPA